MDAESIESIAKRLVDNLVNRLIPPNEPEKEKFWENINLATRETVNFLNLVGEQISRQIKFSVAKPITVRDILQEAISVHNGDVLVSQLKKELKDEGIKLNGIDIQLLVKEMGYKVVSTNNRPRIKI